MDLALTEGLVREMIVVMPNAHNTYQGSFDTHFRTLLQASSRGIAGHSMGGFGAIGLGMKHPDIFGAVYAISPCCLSMLADLGVDNPSWHWTLQLESIEGLEQVLQQGNLEVFYIFAQIALSAAFSPNSQRPPFFVEFPFRVEQGQLVPNEPAFTKWQEHFPVNMVEEYKENLLKLRGLQIEYGVNDQFPHILTATPAFSQKLAEHYIPHVLRVHAGDHGSQVAENMTRVILPFFSQTLEFEVQQ
jgi:S-formylglutathione hydrolase FrmB